MAVYSYCRASTDHQDQSPDTQKGITLEWTKRRGRQPPDYYYVDTNISGKIPFQDRPAGRKLMGVLREGDTVIVAKMDRAFRNLGDFCATVDAWSRRGVILCLCDYELDMATPHGRLFAGMIAGFAEFERSLIVTRITEGMQTHRAAGHRISKDPPIGMMFAPGRHQNRTGAPPKKLVMNPQERATMAQIVAWRHEDPPVLYAEIHARLLADRKYDWVDYKGNVRRWDIQRVPIAYRREVAFQRQEQLEGVAP